MKTTTAATALIEGVFNVLRPLGAVELEECRSKRWASPTFTGARIDLAVLIAIEPEAQVDEKALRQVDIAGGHLLADLEVVECSRMEGRHGVRLRLEALTIEDPIEEAMAA